MGSKDVGVGYDGGSDKEVIVKVLGVCMVNNMSPLCSLLRVQSS